PELTLPARSSIPVQFFACNHLTSRPGDDTKIPTLVVQPIIQAVWPFSGRSPRMGSGTNNKVLFWASFFTLIAAGMGFSIRGDILNEWGRQFGFTQTDLGIITGQGLAGFGIAIIFFSFFADLVGYGKLMIVAFLLHVLSVALTLA